MPSRLSLSLPRSRSAAAPLPRPRRDGVAITGGRPFGWLGWGLSIAAFAIPLALVLGTLVYQRATAVPTVAIQVRSLYDDAPVLAAQVATGDLRKAADGGGLATLPLATTPLQVEVRAAGFHPETVAIDDASRATWDVALRPATLSGRLTDAASGAPIAGANVTLLAGGAVGPTVTSAADGAYQFANVPADASLRVESDLYGRHEQPVGETTALDVGLRPSVVSGVVRDAEGNPVPNARVALPDGSAATVSAADGSYRLDGAAAATELVASAPGYGEQRLAAAFGQEVAFALEPTAIKAIYANLGVLATPERLQALIEIADSTEVNAIVIDVKQDTIYYDTQVPFFRDLEGVVTPIFDPAELLAELDARGIYTIARMVVFKDPVVAEARPDLAVTDEVAGGLWRDDNGSAWVNAFNEELWQANADLAFELGQLGFDEVQYDYIRFPSDGNLRTADFGQEYTEAARRGAITGAVAAGAEGSRAGGAAFSIDLFPIIALMGDDQGIGQTLQDLTPLADYVSLMIYPSHYERGNIPVDGHPNDFPAETVTYTMERAEELVPGTRRKMRPWLQDFTYPLEGYSAYGAEEVRAQIDAAEASGASGWLLWNAAGEFEVAALAPEG